MSLKQKAVEKVMAVKTAMAMAKGQRTTDGVVSAFVVAILGLGLFEPLQNFVEQINASGGLGLLVDLVPVLYIIGLIAGIVALLRLR